ncbi:hypothetical protein T492DRAFT_1152196, partial [Pavlovales sp. CCMP2436]
MAAPTMEEPPASEASAAAAAPAPALRALSARFSDLLADSAVESARASAVSARRRATTADGQVAFEPTGEQAVARDDALLFVGAYVRVGPASADADAPAGAPAGAEGGEGVAAATAVLPTTGPWAVLAQAESSLLARRVAATAARAPTAERTAEPAAHAQLRCEWVRAAACASAFRPLSLAPTAAGLGETAGAEGAVPAAFVDALQWEREAGEAPPLSAAQRAAELELRRHLPLSTAPWEQWVQWGDAPPACEADAGEEDAPDSDGGEEGGGLRDGEGPGAWAEGSPGAGPDYLPDSMLVDQTEAPLSDRHWKPGLPLALGLALVRTAPSAAGPVSALPVSAGEAAAPVSAEEILQSGFLCQQLAAGAWAEEIEWGDAGSGCEEEVSDDTHSGRTALDGHRGQSRYGRRLQPPPLLLNLNDAEAVFSSDLL